MVLEVCFLALLFSTILVLYIVNNVHVCLHGVLHVHRGCGGGGAGGSIFTLYSDQI